MIKSKQKFFRGQRVKIADEMPLGREHFDCGMEAIISEGKYNDNPKGCEYKLVYYSNVLKHYTSSAWYPERLLTLVSGDRDAGEQILQNHQYNLSE